MIKRLFQKLLSKFGKNYTIDESIPKGLFITFLFNRIFMLLRGFFYVQNKIFLGRNCKILNKSNIVFRSNITIENNVTIDGYSKKELVLGNNVKIGAFSLITCTSHLSKYGIGLTIGDNSAFGRFTEFGAAGGIIIGQNVIAGSYVSFHSENHNFSDTSKLIREQGVTSKGIQIGNNVWIGAKVTFLDGSKVGNNTVVAAGAVVSGEFPDNVVIGGIPARIIKNIT